jgi:regulatory protein
VQNSDDTNPIIQKMTKGKRQRTELSLSDGTVILLDNEILISEPLHTGDELTEERRLALIARSSKASIRRLAISLLSRQRYTRKLLRDKLLKSENNRRIVDETLDECENLRLLNDLEYARDWILMRITNHPEGKKNLFFGLLKRGIDKGTADSVVAELVPFEVELEAAVNSLSRHRIAGSSEMKLVSFLVRSGFSREVIKAILKKQKGMDYDSEQ